MTISTFTGSQIADQVGNAISEITRMAMPVTRVYTGAIGCACGCKGNYNDSPRAIKLVVGKIERALREGRVDELMIAPNAFVAVEVGNRAWTAYIDERS